MFLRSCYYFKSFYLQKIILVFYSFSSHKILFRLIAIVFFLLCKEMKQKTFKLKCELGDVIIFVNKNAKNIGKDKKLL